MSEGIHRGSEFHNIEETWNQNEKNRGRGNTSKMNDRDNIDRTNNTDLDRAIKQEAEEYDHENSENKVMGGERASVNDEPER